MKLSSLAALIAVLAAALPIGSVARASNSTPQKVYNITTTASGVVYFFQEGANRTGYPGCASNFPTRWAFNAATPTGQSLLSTLLTAYAAGKPVVVAGNNMCDVAGDTESISYVFIADH